LRVRGVRLAGSPRQRNRDAVFAVENPSGISAKALASILASALSGLTPEAIAQVSPDIVEQIFRQNISMGKGMGLMAMVQAVQALARRVLNSRPGASRPSSRWS